MRPRLVIARTVTSVQPLSSRAIASAGGYLGLICGSSFTACVTSCSPSSLHRCRYLAVCAQPRGRLAKCLQLLTVKCKFVEPLCSACHNRMILLGRAARQNSRIAILVHAQCLEAEFYSWVANGKGLSSDVAGMPESGNCDLATLSPLTNVILFRQARGV